MKPTLAWPRPARRAGPPDAGSPPESVSEMIACLRAAGLRLTPQRLAIVRELAADPTHPTAQELFERLRPELPSMSFATVYNTLDSLASAGLCAALSLSPGPARFDSNMRPHDHAVCDRCGQVRDVSCEAGGEIPPGDEAPYRNFTHPPASGPKPRAPQERGAPSGFDVRTVERVYRGLCEGCAGDAAREQSSPPRGRPRHPT